VVTLVGRGRPGAARPLRRPITLYDLIATIQDVVGPEDDGLVVATVRYFPGTGRLTGARPEAGGGHRRAGHTAHQKRVHGNG
jgi:hypothetical protein